MPGLVQAQMPLRRIDIQPAEVGDGGTVEGTVVLFHGLVFSAGNHCKHGTAHSGAFGTLAYNV